MNGAENNGDRGSDCMKVAAGSTEINLTLENGLYAILVYVDINQNGELDKNLFGIPKEPYGFSNNARGSFGPPSFMAVSIQITEDTRLPINLR